MKLELTVDSKDLLKALVAGPSVLERHMRLAMMRVTMEMARSAKARAPKALSTLTNTIQAVHVSPYEGLVTAGTDYARAVEEGARGGSRMQPVSSILDWVKVRRLTPRDATMDQRDLAFMIARSIAQKGTPAQPFMRPALEDNRERAIRRINAAIRGALKEIAA